MMRLARGAKCSGRTTPGHGASLGSGALRTAESPARSKSGLPRAASARAPMLAPPRARNVRRQISCFQAATSIAGIGWMTIHGFSTA